MVVAGLHLVVTRVLIFRVIELVRVVGILIAPVGVLVVPVVVLIVLISSIGTSTFSTVPSSILLSIGRLLVVLTQDQVECFDDFGQLQGRGTKGHQLLRSLVSPHCRKRCQPCTDVGRLTPCFSNFLCISVWSET